jgi:hypothetical protein
VVEGLTRTRLVQAAQAVSERVGDKVDDVYALYERSNSVVAAGLGAADAEALKHDLALAGAQALVFDTSAVLPCPPARLVDELTWDDAGLKLRTALGVHAVPWRELQLGLAALLVDGPAGLEREADAGLALIDLVDRRWERFRVVLEPGTGGRGRDPHLSPPRLAGAVLDRRTDVPRNEAFTALSIGQRPRTPRFSDPLEHEAWTALWLARSHRAA